MIRSLLTATLVALLTTPAALTQRPAAVAEDVDKEAPNTKKEKAKEKEKEKEKAKEEEKEKTKEETKPSGGLKELPADVLKFHGNVTGTVEGVSTARDQMPLLHLKVTKVEADATKNKAPKPDTLNGMTIVIAPEQKKGEGGKIEQDEAESAYIKAAKTGAVVTLTIRASAGRNGFRLLKVPAATK